MVHGALTELSGKPGSGKTEFILRFLAVNPQVRVAWIEDQLTAYPCAFPAHGVGLHRVLFVEAGKDIVWAALQIINSRIFQVVVLSTTQRLKELELRRLQLACEKAAISGILLVDYPTPGAWPISFQAAVERSEAAEEELPRLKVLKQKLKEKRASSWKMETA